MSRPREFLDWAVETFGDIAVDQDERARRFAEEAIELSQAAGLDMVTLRKIIDHVYSRPRGNIFFEIGQAQVCLEILAENLGASADELAEREFSRVRAVPKHEWKRRHDAKVVLGIASN